MPGQTGYQALLEALRTKPAPAPQAFMTRLQETYGLEAMLYADLVLEGRAFVPGTLIHSPDRVLERLISKRGTTALQPLFDAATALFGPSLIHVDDVFRTAEGSDHRRNGFAFDGPLLVFPLVPSRPGLAFFACEIGHLNHLANRHDALLRDLAALAGLFHAAQVAEKARPPRPSPVRLAEPRLTPREREVLQWVAAGKTYWEIARIIGISQRTVRHFMAACREKLDAVSNKQAVAKAVAGRLIEFATPFPDSSN